MSRLALMKARIAARTDGKGKPLPGYKRNVEALKAEVARLELEEQRAAPSKDTP